VIGFRDEIGRPACADLLDHARVRSARDPRKGEIMPNFIFVYHGGSRPESEAEQTRVMDAWRAWMGGIGEALIQPGNPVGMSKTATASGIVDNGGANPVSGYSVVSAASIDAAMKMAQECPILADTNGSVEVAEILEM
jgi:hypothetical protein